MAGNDGDLGNLLGNKDVTVVSGDTREFDGLEWNGDFEGCARSRKDDDWLLYSGRGF
jgi:hypothetical protein